MFHAEAALGQQQCPQLTTDPQTCARLWERIGLPESRKGDDEEDYRYVCHLGFMVRHNNLTKTPDWVIERLSSAEVKKEATRPRVGFKAEACIPPGKRAVDADYVNSLFARGHQAPSDDFSFNLEWMKDTFVLSNVVPQEGEGFNSGIWLALEKRIRRIAAGLDEIYVITGPVYQKPGARAAVVPAAQNPCENEVTLESLDRRAVCGGTREEPNRACEGGVAIPAGLFKIVFIPPDRMNAYILPNIDHSALRERGTSVDAYLARWRVSVNNVEERVQYDFFPDFSRRERRTMEEECPATRLR
jgi:DNA/RNA endonuclease G (NUC1)